MITRRTFVFGVPFAGLLGTLFGSSATSGIAVVVRGLADSSSADGWFEARRALDLGLSRLLGVEASEAWASVLAAGHPVSIKLDGHSPLASTGDALAVAVLEALFDRLVQPWQVTLWEKRSSDVGRRSWRLKTRRGRMRVTSVESSNFRDGGQSGYSDSIRYPAAWLGEAARPSHYASLLDPAPATLINMPAAKHHPLVGVDGALMSLALGSVDDEGRFLASSEVLSRAVAEIWRRKPLRGHSLTVMDATRVVFHGGPVGLPSWISNEGAIIIGTDPVAVDAAALEMIEVKRAAAKLPSCLEQGMALLEKAEELGIGKARPRIVEVNITAA